MSTFSDENDFRSVTDDVLKVMKAGIKEIDDFSQLTEDCFELSWWGDDGEYHEVQLDDKELEFLSAMFEELADAWEGYTRAGHEVYAEAASERRQMGFCNF